VEDRVSHGIGRRASGNWARVARATVRGRHNPSRNSQNSFRPFPPVIGKNGHFIPKFTALALKPMPEIPEMPAASRAGALAENVTIRPESVAFYPPRPLKTVLLRFISCISPVKKRKEGEGE
jgi:hypothetical protein